MNSQIINYASYSLDVLLIYRFLSRIFKININKKDIIYLIGLMFINISIRNVLGVNNFQTYIAINLVSAIIYYHLINKGLLNVTVYTILAYLFFGLLELISVNIVILTFRVGPKLISELNIYRILTIIISKVSFYYITSKFAHKIKLPKYTNIKRKKIIFSLLLFNVFNIFMIYSLYKYAEESSTVDLINLTTLVLSAIFLSIYIYKFLKEVINQDQQQLVQKAREEALSKTDFYIENMREILKTINSQRHDLNNYLGTLYGLIYLEKYERAKEYIEKINDEIRDFNTIIDTNNPVLTALLNIKKNKSHKNGIQMNIDINLPESLDFDNIDLSVVVGNLLDNAIEACEKIDERLNKYINVDIFLEEDILYIQIDNSKSVSNNLNVNDIMGRFTTKKNKENHGFGLGNVEFVVNKYDGEIEVKDLGEQFLVNIEIPIKTKALNV